MTGRSQGAAGQHGFNTDQRQAFRITGRRALRGHAGDLRSCPVLRHLIGWDPAGQLHTDARGGELVMQALLKPVAVSFRLVAAQSDRPAVQFRANPGQRID